MNQPDFNATTQAFNATAQAFNFIGTELGKCTNLPVIQGGDAILTALQTLTTEVRALRVEVRTEVQALSSRMQAIEHNNTARLQNRFLQNPGAQLMKLHDTNNNPINSFPENSAALQQLRGPQIDALLVALNMSNDGLVEQRRTRLRVAIGLRDTGIA